MGVSHKGGKRDSNRRRERGEAVYRGEQNQSKVRRRARSGRWGGGVFLKEEGVEGKKVAQLGGCVEE